MLPLLLAVGLQQQYCC